MRPSTDEDIHVPEFALGEDLVIEPDGTTRTPADKVQAEALRDVVRDVTPTTRRKEATCRR